MPSLRILLLNLFVWVHCHSVLTLRLLMSYRYIYMELLVKPEMLTSYIYGPTFGNAVTVCFYLLHNVSTLNQCREVSYVTFVCKHFASQLAKCLHTNVTQETSLHSFSVETLCSKQKETVSTLPNVGPYIYDVSISGFTRSSIYIRNQQPKV